MEPPTAKGWKTLREGEPHKSESKKNIAGDT